MFDVADKPSKKIDYFAYKMVEWNNFLQYVLAFCTEHEQREGG